MKRKWAVCRSLVQRGDGQRRWDIAYQRLLQWTQKVAGVIEPGPAPIITQEVKDESRSLCAGVDLTTTTKSNY